MSDFNPGNSLVSIGFESVAPTMLPTVWHDHEFVSESLSADAGSIEDDSITSSSQRPPSLKSKIATDGSIEFRAESEGFPYYLCGLQKGLDTTENVVDTVWTHKLGPSQGTGNDFASTYGVRVWRDDSLIHYFKSCKTKKVTFSLAPRSLLKSTVDIIAERADYFGRASVVNEGSANTYRPELVGIPNYSNFSLDDSDVYIKATDVSGLPDSFKAKVKIGSASTYDGAEIEIAIGLGSNGRPSLTILTDETGAYIGDRSLQVEASLYSGTGYEVGDEYKIGVSSTIWTPDFPDVPKFNEIFAAIYVDGEEFAIDQFSLTIEGTANPYFKVGGRYSHRTIERGQRKVSLSMQKMYLDTKARKLLETGHNFRVVVETFTGETIASGYEHKIKLVSPLCVPSGRTPSVGGNSSMNETINATCHPDPTDVDYPDDVTVEIVNTIEDMTL